MEAIVARGIQLLIALAGAYLVALWFVLVVWTFRDIETRSKSVVTQIFSTLLVVLFYVPGVLLYLILRPKETLDAAFQRSLEEEYLLQDLEELPLCVSCQHYVEDDFMLCPHCHAKLRDACTSCGRLVSLRWSLCPYCGVEQSGKEARERERVPAPAARWSAPALQRRRGRPVTVPRPILAPPPFGEAPDEAVDLAAFREGSITATSLTMLRNVANGSPLRLFDRKKTRAAARKNGFGRSAGTDVDGNGRDPDSTGNGVAELNGHHAVGSNGTRYSANGHSAVSTNGHSGDGAQPTRTAAADSPASAHGETRQPIPVSSARDGD